MRTIAEAMAEKGIEPEVKEEAKTEPTTEPTTTPQVDNETTEVKEPKTPTSDDIINRVAQIKNSPEVEDTDTDSDSSTKFNVNDIDKIEDPVAREQAWKAYRSLEKGYQEKFQSVASERKQLQAERDAMGQWTPEKVQSLLSNEAFIKASQSVVQSQNPTNGEISDEQWSNLTDAEKNQISSMQRELQEMKQLSKMEKYQAQLKEQDRELAIKYSNYDAEKVNQLRNDMMAGKIQATNEHLFKVVNYETAIKNAYQMGKEDRKLDIGEKVNASSESETLSRTTGTSEPLVKSENENPADFLKRIIQTNLAKKKTK